MIANLDNWWGRGCLVPTLCDIPLLDFQHNERARRWSAHEPTSTDSDFIWNEFECDLGSICTWSDNQSPVYNLLGSCTSQGVCVSCIKSSIAGWVVFFLRETLKTFFYNEVFVVIM